MPLVTSMVLFIFPRCIVVLSPSYICTIIFIMCGFILYSCLFAGLTTARINLIFCIHILIWSDCAIGYMILTFEVIKGHFRSNKFLWQVPLSLWPEHGFYLCLYGQSMGLTSNLAIPMPGTCKFERDFFFILRILGRLLCYLRILGRLLCYNFTSKASKILVYLYI